MSYFIGNFMYLGVIETEDSHSGTSEVQGSEMNLKFATAPHAVQVSARIMVEFITITKPTDPGNSCTGQKTQFHSCTVSSSSVHGVL